MEDDNLPTWARDPDQALETKIRERARMEAWLAGVASAFGWCLVMIMLIGILGGLWFLFH